MSNDEQEPVRIEREAPQGLAKPAAGGIVGRPKDIDRKTPIEERLMRNGKKHPRLK